MDTPHTHLTIGDRQFQLTALPCGNDEKLYIIACITNYVRYKRRYELFWKFKHMIDKLPNVSLYVVEVAFGDREFMVTEQNNSQHLQLRTNNELWHKENSINLMVQKLPSNWKYLAWVDADINFTNVNFVEETIHQLQHYRIVQMFQNVVNLNHEGGVVSTFNSFMYQYHKGSPYNKNKYEFWHPGFAWACTRDAWNGMGGLLDIAILGAGDHHMALAWIGLAERSLPVKIGDNYRRHVLNYQERCEKHIKRDVGYVPGTIIHSWHGSFKDRKYVERWGVLIDNKFDPDMDIKRDWQGLYIINNDDKIGLRDGIKKYFRARNEDSIDM